MPSIADRPAGLNRFLADEQGATAIEYGLIAGCISVAIAGTALSVGTALNEHYYDKILDAFLDARGGAGGEGGEGT